MKLGWIVPVLLILVILLLVALLMFFQSPGERPASQELTYSQLLDMGPKLKSALIRGDELMGRDETGRPVSVQLPRDTALADRLAKNGTVVTIGVARADSNWVGTLLVNGIPLVVWAIIWIYPLRRLAHALEALAARPDALTSPTDRR